MSFLDFIIWSLTVIFISVMILDMITIPFLIGKKKHTGFWEGADFLGSFVKVVSFFPIFGRIFGWW